MRFYPNLVAEVWFAYPKDPASWGELQADYDSDSTMNVHEKVHMTIRLNMIGPQMSNRLYLEKKGIACGWKHFFFKFTVPMGTR